MVCSKCGNGFFMPAQDWYLSCVSCGSLVDVVPAELPGDRPWRNKPGYDHKTRTLVYEVVREHYDHIEVAIITQTWAQVTEYLKRKTGYRLRSQTVQKYFVFIGELNAEGAT